MHARVYKCNEVGEKKETDLGGIGEREQVQVRRKEAANGAEDSSSDMGHKLGGQGRVLRQPHQGRRRLLAARGKKAKQVGRVVSSAMGVTGIIHCRPAPLLSRQWTTRVGSRRADGRRTGIGRGLHVDHRVRTRAHKRRRCRRI
jgi:hypothetical protein